jgi:hypothetical protein
LALPKAFDETIASQPPAEGKKCGTNAVADEHDYKSPPQPEEKPLPTLKIPPGKSKTLQQAKSSGKRRAPQGPKSTTRFWVRPIRSTIGKKRESNKNNPIATIKAAN